MQEEQDEAHSSIDIQTQLATLVSKQLVSLTSPPDDLSDVKLRCEAEYSLVKQQSQSINFPLEEYLHCG